MSLLDPVKVILLNPKHLDSFMIEATFHVAVPKVLEGIFKIGSNRMT